MLRATLWGIRVSNIISVAQTEGGSAKTTTVLSLAGHWVIAGRKVAVVDAGGPQHHAANWLRDLPEESPLSRITITTLQEVGSNANNL